MSRVDFHSNVPDKLAYACRLARKAYMAGNKVVVLAQDSAQLDALNTAMWTFPPRISCPMCWPAIRWRRKRPSS